MLSADLHRQFLDTGRVHNIDPALLAAIADIESGLRFHARIDGRDEPLIRFEGHYFDRRLSGGKQAQARRLGLSDPRAGAVANPAAQAARWALLARARQIDRKAADESVSWGVGQVMGAHWAWLGFRDVDALVSEARAGAAGQLRLMLAYIERAGLKPALARHDWAAFARGYNGPNYRSNAYDTKLAAAFARHRKAFETGIMLARGARGEEVRRLQEMLVGAGFALDVDGRFGPLTEAALKGFQQSRGLAASGIVDAATRTALESRPSLLAAFFGWLAGVRRAAWTR